MITTTFIRRLSLAIVACLILIVFAKPANAAGGATYFVHPAGYLTISSAIADAAPGDTIRILSAVHTEADIVVSKNLTIEGLGIGNTILQPSATPQADAGRMFHISGGADVTIQQLTIRNGDPIGSQSGGAIKAEIGSDLILAYVTFQDNHTLPSGKGGAIYMQGNLSVTNSHFVNNSAIIGGAVYLGNPSGRLPVSAEINDTLLFQNTATYSGGALYSSINTTLNHVTLTSNQAGAGSNFNGGGAVWFGRHDATLTIEGGSSVGNNVTLGSAAVSAETDKFGGGGVFSSTGNIIIRDSDFYDNSTNGHGGGIYQAQHANSQLIVERTSFESNNAMGHGGGLFAGRLSQLFSSTFEDNSATDGGGIFAFSQGFILQNSTLSANNSINNGGGLFVQAYDSAAQIFNATIAENTANRYLSGDGRGGGLYFEEAVSTPNAKLYLHNTLIGDNAQPFLGLQTHAPDCYGSLTSGGYNLIESLGTTIVGTPCTIDGHSNLIGIDPRLIPLANNGGPTKTHALAAGDFLTSAAIDGGYPSGCSSSGGPLTSDQRGYSRTDARCDIGAYEYNAVPTAVALKAQQAETASSSIFLFAFALVNLTFYRWRKSER